MKVLDIKLRAVVERVTTMEHAVKGQKKHLFIFEQLGEKGESLGQRIQDWECNNITSQFCYSEREEIYKAVQEHWAQVAARI